VRGGFYILGRAAGGINGVHIDNFVSRFPKDYEALDSMTVALLPSKSAYGAARKQVLRMLAVLDEVDLPWEQLRMLIRRAARGDIENGLYSLRRAALDGGLAPSDIRTEWAFKGDIRCDRGYQGLRLYRDGKACIRNSQFVAETFEHPPWDRPAHWRYPQNATVI